MDVYSLRDEASEQIQELLHDHEQRETIEWIATVISDGSFNPVDRLTNIKKALIILDKVTKEKASAQVSYNQ